jgi:hypothetical protein
VCLPFTGGKNSDYQFKIRRNIAIMRDGKFKKGNYLIIRRALKMAGDDVKLVRQKRADRKRWKLGTKLTVEEIEDGIEKGALEGVLDNE